MRVLPRWAGVVLLAAATLGACAPRMTRERSVPDLRIESLSARPYLVTGGDVLLRIAGGDLDGLRVEANGADVTSRFRPVPGGSWVGLVEGLPDGESMVRATVPGAGAALALTSHPVTGPILSGPHEQPFVCQTAEFTLVTGERLGPPLDSACSVETRVDYVYLSTTDGKFRPYPRSPGARTPADVASTTTLDGVTVPFVVRVQTGTVNRAVYESALLHDPADPEPDPWTRSRGWNGRLVYTHGGGCRSGWFVQGRATGGVLHQGLLGMGFATTSSSLNVFGVNCNDLLASETHIMVKERFVESYGLPEHTIGWGSSGGAYQSHQTADNYPGVFDGIIVTSSFPDVTSATIFTAADARLLHRYFAHVAPGLFTREQQRRVAGFGVWESIGEMSRAAARIDPTYEPGAPAEEQGGELKLPELVARRYSASIPGGLRATVYDHTVNVYGIEPATGFAGRPLDNRGVQYGLAALDRGEITPAQFIALNRDIGGFDADLNPVTRRHRADPLAAERATGTGRILHGGGGLATTPVVDYRSYLDHQEGGDVHMIVHQHSTRARLLAANGHAANQVMTVGGRWGFTDESPDLGELFRQMDRWLTDLRADTTRASAAEKVVRAKPVGLVEGCWDGQGPDRGYIPEALSADGTGRCSELYPVYLTPRHVAGAPLANDIVTCHLKAVDPRDYSVDFTAAEMDALRETFPDGVCDWSRGDVHSRGYQGTWRSFGPSPENLVRRQPSSPAHGVR